MPAYELGIIVIGAWPTSLYGARRDTVVGISSVTNKQ